MSGLASTGEECIHIPVYICVPVHTWHVVFTVSSQTVVVRGGLQKAAFEVDGGYKLAGLESLMKCGMCVCVGFVVWE